MSPLTHFIYIPRLQPPICETLVRVGHTSAEYGMEISNLWCSAVARSAKDDVRLSAQGVEYFNKTLPAFAEDVAALDLMTTFDSYSMNLVERSCVRFIMLNACSHLLLICSFLTAYPARVPITVIYTQM